MLFAGFENSETSRFSSRIYFSSGRNGTKLILKVSPICLLLSGRILAELEWRVTEKISSDQCHVLVQLDRGPEHFGHHRLWVGEDLERVKEQYQELKEVLSEVDKEATEILARTPPRPANLFDSLTPVGIRRISPDVYARHPTPVPIVAHLQYSRSPRPPTLCFSNAWVRLQVTPSRRRPALRTHSRASRYLRTIVMSRKYAACIPPTEGGSAGGRAAYAIVFISIPYTVSCNATCRFIPLPGFQYNIPVTVSSLVAPFKRP